MLQMFSQVFSDIKILYSNFIHWNISKIIIGIMGVLLGILMAIPFFLLAFLLAYFSPIDWKTILQSLYLGNSFDFLIMSVFAQNLFYFISILFLSLLGVGFFLLGNSYKYVLISKLYLNYIDGEKPAFFKGNIYFSLKYIKKYTSILGVSAMYMLVPILAFIILAILLIFTFGGFESVSAMMTHVAINSFSLILFILFIILVLVFFYITYRLQFAFFSFLDDKNEFLQKASYYVKESFIQTKALKTLGKYLVLIISMGIFFLPFFYVEGNIARNLEELDLMNSYKTDDKFVKTMSEDQKYEVSLLEKKYIDYNNDDLKYELTKYNAYSIIWGILYFVILGNLENMVFISFYRRVLRKEETEDNNK